MSNHDMQTVGSSSYDSRAIGRCDPAYGAVEIGEEDFEVLDRFWNQCLVRCYQHIRNARLTPIPPEVEVDLTHMAERCEYLDTLRKGREFGQKTCVARLLRVELEALAEYHERIANNHMTNAQGCRAAARNAHRAGETS